MPSERSEALLGRELTTDENSVRGTLVAGLTAKDIALLDMFEGNARISLSYCSSSYPKHAPPPFSFCVVSGGGALRLSCSLLYCAAHLGIKKKTGIRPFAGARAPTGPIHTRSSDLQLGGGSGTSRGWPAGSCCYTPTLPASRRAGPDRSRTELCVVCRRQQTGQ